MCIRDRYQRRVHGCTALNYTINSKKKYTLICPFDYPSNNVSPTIAGTLAISQWKFPFNFGLGAPVRNKLRYIWSGADGNLGMYRVDTSLGTLATSDCTVITQTSHNISTNFQKVTFQLKSYTTLKLATLNNQLQIKQIFSLYPDMELAIPQCYVDGFKCTVIRNSNTNVFTLEMLSISENQLNNKTFKIAFWVNGGPSSSSVSYKGELLALYDSNFYIINDCPAYENWNPGSQQIYKIDFYDIQMPSTLNSQGIFTFRFVITTSFYDFCKIQFDLSS
eukprot:TRINITY_DN2162_c0_g1_i4.p1 TRINITY_DN2162_c0_g1~~TRINITY_DN2162_c0_g1_i4.p1  ORF type:complete len:278 (-),score=37.22 TRINITY_DN2162_c0_g1_i4:582-1415(-)